MECQAYFSGTPTSTLIPTIGTGDINPTGDQQFAADIYGAGVRAGFYLQSFGTLLSLWSANPTTGIGVKLAGAANIIAILTSWSFEVSNKTISPSEAYLVLFLISVLQIPVVVATLNLNTILGEGIGLFAVQFAALCTNGATVWFWATGYKQLPILNTKNLVWFFAKVSVTGWFRIFMLVVTSIALLISLSGAYFNVKHFGPVVWKNWRHGDRGLRDHIQQIRKLYPLKIQKAIMRFMCIFGIAQWIFTVLGIEYIIQYNDLMPEQDATKPGQTIPVILGCFIFVDGVATVLRPIFGKPRQLDHEMQEQRE